MDFSHRQSKQKMGTVECDYVSNNDGHWFHRNVAKITVGCFSVHPWWLQVGNFDVSRYRPNE